MAYEVTATRKRPQVFENLVGQDFVVSTIRNSIEKGTIAHAYLFSGPRGVGKTSSARLLAKALNCEEGMSGHPCGKCDNCREITAGNSPDVIEIDGASNTSVNDVRVIKDEVLFPPSKSRYKIYIIDEVHMLSTSAFNALLKTIEEPPEYIVFIFATTEPQKVPATIRSRCQQFRFRLIDLETIKGCLKSAADDLGIEADDDAIFWIAKESTGSMRDAYTIFDQVASFCPDKHITLERISRKLGLVGMEKIFSVLREVKDGHQAAAISQVQQILSDGVSVEQTIKDFAICFRTMLMRKNGISDEEILGARPETIPEDVLSMYSVPQLEAGTDLFLRLYRDVRYSLNPRFDLELAVSRLYGLMSYRTTDETIKAIERLKKDIVDECVKVRPGLSFTPSPQSAAPVSAPVSAPSANPAAAPAPAPVSSPSAAPAPAPEPVAEPAPAPAPQPDPVKPSEEPEKTAHVLSDEEKSAIASKLDEKIPGMGATFNKLTRSEVRDGQLVLVFPSNFASDRIKTNMRMLSQALSDISSYSGTVGVVTEIPVRKTVKSDDPITEKVLDFFGGEIIQ